MPKGNYRSFKYIHQMTNIWQQKLISQYQLEMARPFMSAALMELYKMKLAGHKTSVMCVL